MDLSYSGVPSQSQSQSPKMILTAEMKESLELLQLPLKELQEKVEEMVTENPVLEYDENNQSDNDCFLNDTLDFVPDQDKAQEIAKMLSSIDDYPFSRSYGASNNDGGYLDAFAAISSHLTFTDYLLTQLSELNMSHYTAKICRYIIESLNEKGYLCYEVHEIARDLKVPPTDVQKSLDIVQQMDPAGVGSKNLQECLTIQIMRTPHEHNAKKLEIIRDYMDLLAKNKIREIAEHLDILLETAQEYCDSIKKLQPYPSSGYNSGPPATYIIPEAVILKAENGGIVIQMNDGSMPHLYISSTYRQMVVNSDNKETVEYLRDKLKRATAFINGINNRTRTITLVLKKLVEKQPMYFEKSNLFLNPMTIADIAQDLGLNESTISRAIHGKYIVCQYGMVSLKSFFTSKIKRKEGDISSSIVKQNIQNLISQENKTCPLSDQDICDKLSLIDISISRRTVNKYRDKMGIRPASGRKIYK